MLGLMDLDIAVLMKGVFEYVPGSLSCEFPSPLGLPPLATVPRSPCDTTPLFTMELRSTRRKRAKSLSCGSDMDEPVSLLHINVNASSLPSHLNAHVATLDEPSSPIHLDVATLDKQTSSVASNLRESGFVDANMAGGNLSKSCTLILTEGLSAKSFVMTFLSHVGSDRYGVYPLRGKVKNIRDVKTIVPSVLDTDSRNIAAALGIKAGCEYEVEDISSDLRYGHVLIMTDQDSDGIHIKGLLLNLFHRVWPSLLEIEDFLQDFTTTLIKAKHERTNEECFFKSLEEYKKWEASKGPSEMNNWRMKYYKGLASHSDKEAIGYSKNLNDHLRVFKPCGNVVEKQRLDIWMDIAFSKNNSDLRKKWLKAKLECPDYTEKSITICSFIEKELILYYKEDLQRSIPSLMDGLKQSQRKVMFYLCEEDSTDQKVCHLSAKVSEATAYHHGDQVLEEVIIRMAQCFSGSNNINLLEPNGQFGSRRKASYDHGGSRYIGMELAPISRLLFLEVDYDLVTHKQEDGKRVEPMWYAPIVPLILINGAMGIGTGYSTRIPSYKPTDVIDNVRMLLEKKPMKQMVPWYRDFEGEVLPDENQEGTYLVRAKWELHDTKLKIYDLPPGVWFDKYEKILAAKKKRSKIKDYKKITERGKDVFEVDLIENLKSSEVEKMFELSKKVSTTNLVLLDSLGHVKHYESIEKVLEEFYAARLQIYRKRKLKLLRALRDELNNVESLEEVQIFVQRIKDLNETAPETLWEQDLKCLEEKWNSSCNEETSYWNTCNEETCTTDTSPGPGPAGILVA